MKKVALLLVCFCDYAKFKTGVPRHAPRPAPHAPAVRWGEKKKKKGERATESESEPVHPSHIIFRDSYSVLWGERAPKRK